MRRISRSITRRQRFRHRNCRSAVRNVRHRQRSLFGARAIRCGCPGSIPRSGRLSVRSRYERTCNDRGPGKQCPDLRKAGERVTDPSHVVSVASTAMRRNPLPWRFVSEYEIIDAYRRRTGNHVGVRAASRVRRSMRRPAQATRCRAGFLCISANAGQNQRGKRCGNAGMLQSTQRRGLPASRRRRGQQGAGRRVAEKQQALWPRQRRSAGGERAGKSPVRRHSEAVRRAAARAAAALASPVSGPGRCSPASGPAAPRRRRQRDGRCGLRPVRALRRRSAPGCRGRLRPKPDCWPCLAARIRRRRRSPRAECQPRWHCRRRRAARSAGARPVARLGRGRRHHARGRACGRTTVPPPPQPIQRFGVQGLIGAPLNLEAQQGERIIQASSSGSGPVRYEERDSSCRRGSPALPSRAAG